MDLGSNDFNCSKYYGSGANDIIDDPCGTGGTWSPTCESETITGLTREKRKQKSMVWKYFDQIQEMIKGRVIR